MSGQELDPIDYTVSIMPTWWIFSPPSGFSLYQENFTHNPDIFTRLSVFD